MTKEIGGPSDGGGLDNGGGCGCGGGGGGGIGRIGPPPAFLTKTFQIVNDETTNSIISWGEFGNSFIIWDHLKFTADILPNYFRHNNFSSFVYQLNNYGFRKIGVDHQWEYANKDFQQGKQHLLSNMKRRSLQTPTTRRRNRGGILSPENVRSAIDALEMEVSKLKMQQSDIHSHIMELEQKTNNVEAISKKLIVEWAKACEIATKRKREIPFPSGDDDDDDDDDEAAAKREKAVVVVSDDEIPPEKNDQNEMVKENDEVKLKSAAEIDGNYSNDLNWMKKLFEDDDDEVCEIEREKANQHAKIAQDFEELLIDQVDAEFFLQMKNDFEELLTKQADADYSCGNEN